MTLTKTHSQPRRIFAVSIRCGTKLRRRIGYAPGWSTGFASYAGACLKQDGGNDDYSAVSTPPGVTPVESLPAPVEPAAASPLQTADDPPSSDEPSAESEPAVTEPAVAGPPKSKRRVTKRGAPAKKANYRPRRYTRNSAK
ncbi:hypothetical protein GN958_ATG22728 [Phytophthora infestans]|uniref:Uncharacterized protein n=1 Tax=Phytophthora infestans TaxID=4787 RepID=A0A8S9THD2_PHYIN|nr:hypothetical protein GN958_ATG22728 [Phytophthora infestans]